MPTPPQKKTLSLPGNVLLPFSITENWHVEVQKPVGLKINKPFWRFVWGKNHRNFEDPHNLRCTKRHDTPVTKSYLLVFGSGLFSWWDSLWDVVSLNHNLSLYEKFLSNPEFFLGESMLQVSGHGWEIATKDTTSPHLILNVAHIHRLILGNRFSRITVNYASGQLELKKMTWRHWGTKFLLPKHHVIIPIESICD